MQFKSFSERVDEVDINVYRSLEKVKAEPSEGSSFFRDCLIEWRVCLNLQFLSFSCSVYETFLQSLAACRHYMFVSEGNLILLLW